MYTLISLILSYCLTVEVTCDGNKMWDGLKILVTPDKIPSEYMNIPRTESKAIKKGWKAINTQCDDQNSKFLGFRYTKKDDVTLILIYDVKGYIAGAQISIPKSSADKNGVVDYSKSQNVFADSVLGKDVYVSTAYFIDPKIICKTGRNFSEYKKQFSGNALYLQNGSNPIQDSEIQPDQDGDALEKLGWFKSACIPNLGRLYHNDFRANKSCSDLTPFVLLFDDMTHRMLGFGFYFFGDYPGARFYHPSEENLQGLPKPFPNCLLDSFKKAGGLVASHIFITKNPVFTCSP